MAYLSDDDQKNQQDQSSGQSNFNILAPASSATSSSAGAQDQSGDSSGGSYNSSSTPSAGSDSGQSSNASNANAQNYTQSLSGTDTQDMSKPVSSAIKQNTANTGLTSGTSGGGYINFQSYANANPSTANQISSAGDKLVANEKAGITYADPSSGFSSAVPGDTDVNSTVSKILNGTATDAEKASLKNWENESYTTPDLSYNPSDNWNQNAGLLSQTSTVGVGTPSVIDYFARPDIQAGTYGLGERTLDQALLSGDTKAQQAIQNNQQKFSDLQNQIGSKIGDLQSQAAADEQKASSISSGANSAVKNAEQYALNQLNDKTNARNEFIKNAEAQWQHNHPNIDINAADQWLRSSGLGPRVDSGVIDQLRNLSAFTGESMPQFDWQAVGNDVLQQNMASADSVYSPGSLYDQAAKLGLSPADVAYLGLPLPANVTPSTPGRADATPWNSGYGAGYYSPPPPPPPQASTNDDNDEAGMRFL